MMKRLAAMTKKSLENAYLKREEMTLLTHLEDLKFREFL